MNQNRNTFKYSNKNYTINVVLYTSDSDDDLRIVFDANDIEVVEYSTKLNGLLVDGKVIYTD